MSASIGLIGLGTMGSALALNIADNDFTVAVYNRTDSVTKDFVEEAGDLADKIVPAYEIKAFVESIESPRSILLMVPSGKPVDGVIDQLMPFLDKDDLLIDAGNANFRDTIRRTKAFEDEGRPFVGIGVSGGEEGARHGPSIMGGGSKQAWDRIEPIMQAISAKFEGTPCATWMGPNGAGHFVKAVHNGIEYADMQIIAEAYGIMRDGLGMVAADIGDVFAKWNDGQLQSYLIEISAEVARTTDPKTKKPLLDIILDKAGQKGTGRWTAIEAHHLGSPVPTIEAAVAARNLSAKIEDRKAGEAIFGPAPSKINRDKESVIEQLEQAVLAGKIACYAQGFDMLLAASKAFDWNLPMPEIAKVWREGCIIRSAMLDDMATALDKGNDENLMFADDFKERMSASHQALRQITAEAMTSGQPVPALASAVSYFDMMRTARSMANMIQGQRDFFGLHSFERVDEEGSHHGPWAD